MSISNYVNRYHYINEKICRRDKACRGAHEHIRNLEILVTGCRPEELYELNERIRAWKRLLEELNNKRHKQYEDMSGLFKEARDNHPSLKRRRISLW